MTGKENLKRVREMACLICKRFVPTGQPVESHHVAEGSGQRSDWAAVPLCVEHHRGALGLHGPKGTKWFLKFYRPPGESEWGLLAWAVEDWFGSR